MMNEPIYNMSIPDLRKNTDLKEQEYREALKAKKLFWEVKIIFEEKREIEKQLIKKMLEPFT